MSDFLQKLWYNRHPLRWLLLPLAWAYQFIVSCRRLYLVHVRQQNFAVPVIVVGNLTVGGVGKTPLVIELARRLQEKGLRVGVVSRGYGAEITKFPHLVHVNDEARLVGDEPLLIARKTHCPVVIAPKRVEAVRFLLDNYQSQIIISDDGLQHYALGRSLEIVVIDGIRGFGSGLCLPAGPLREPISRLKKADFLVVNEGEWPGAYRMALKPGNLTHLITKTSFLGNLPAPIAAVAAIGHPQRFFNTLSELGLSFNPYSFTDHHLFEAKDLKFSEKTVIMTEKDAMKCEAFAADNWYYLPVKAELTDSFWQALWDHKQLKGYIQDETTTLA